MIRLYNFPCNYYIARKKITDNLIDWILTVLGPTDENGEFIDPKRMKSFMKGCPAFKPLVGKMAFRNEGLLKAGIRYEDLLKARYEDILAKLEDERHEYSFDEFGEALIVAICLYRNDIDVESELGSYPDNRIKEDFYEAPSCKRMEGYDESLEEWGGQRYDELAEDSFFMKDHDGKLPEKEKWVKAYAYLMSALIDDVGTYSIDPLADDFWLRDACDYAGIDTDCGLSSFATSFLFDDGDYEDVLERIGDIESLDRYLKCVGDQLGTTIRSARDLFREHDDVYDLEGNPLES